MQPEAAARRTPSLRIAPADVVDVFVYTFVLALAAEHFPGIISESFTVSVLTAVLLKVILEAVVAIKNEIKARRKAATTPAGKAFGVALLWLLLAGSKLVVLEVVALVLGDRVHLGGFFAVTGLVLVLMAARAGVRRLLATGGAG